MSRRRHTADSIARRCGWALDRVLKGAVHCPECGATGEGAHRNGCGVERALREYREWVGKERRDRE